MGNTFTNNRSGKLYYPDQTRRKTKIENKAETQYAYYGRKRFTALHSANGEALNKINEKEACETYAEKYINGVK